MSMTRLYQVAFYLIYESAPNLPLCVRALSATLNSTVGLVAQKNQSVLALWTPYKNSDDDSWSFQRFIIYHLYFISVLNTGKTLRKAYGASESSSFLILFKFVRPELEH